ncbi:MFS transporter [Pseudooceanicola sp.]|uniref:MFS transporter n=1 Tax=Pseudooceanicola sp. TaxID=1914328 RepID=UPI0035C76C5A
MRFDFVLLIAAYVLSQFFRSFLPVLTGVLEQDIGATAADLSNAAGVWFLTFAAMQLPVGWALDRLGPRRTAAVLLGLGGGGGALLFAFAQAPWHIVVGMGLVGVGCAPVLMASYYILARVYPAAMFATFASLIVGIGQLGNLAGSLPLALAVEAFGWRSTMLVLAVACIAMALALGRVILDPPQVTDAPAGGLGALFRIPGFWLVLPFMLVSYAPVAGIRALWSGPYFAQVFAADTRDIGNYTLAIGLAMILGTLTYGPADRFLGTRKWLNVGAATTGVVLLLWLAIMPPATLAAALAVMVGIAFVTSNYAVIIAHGRAFLPPHLVGRGVTMVNLCGIGGAGVAQILTGAIFERSTAAATQPQEAFAPIFLYYAAALAAGLVAYLFIRDRTD